MSTFTLKAQCAWKVISEVDCKLDIKLLGFGPSPTLTVCSGLVGAADGCGCTNTPGNDMYMILDPADPYYHPPYPLTSIEINGIVYNDGDEFICFSCPTPSFPPVPSYPCARAFLNINTATKTIHLIGALCP